jgi:hypothetical protein
MPSGVPSGRQSGTEQGQSALFPQALLAVRWLAMVLGGKHRNSTDSREHSGLGEGSDPSENS